MDDARRLAEVLYDEKLGDDAGSVLVELLDLHADRTGQNTPRHAGRILRGAVRPGRKRIDDSDALRRIAAFPPWQRREAVGKVAQFEAGPGASDKQVETIAQRLRRKLREENETNEMDVCATSDR
jgi:uncharacterized protein with von Willebrand factor type A (vWA) domain